MQIFFCVGVGFDAYGRIVFIGILFVLNVTPKQLLTGEGIDDNCIEYKPINTSSEPEFSKADIRIMKDIHEMKEAQRKRLLKYIDALKQI